MSEIVITINRSVTNLRIFLQVSFNDNDDSQGLSGRDGTIVIPYYHFHTLSPSIIPFLFYLLREIYIKKMNKSSPQIS